MSPARPDVTPSAGHLHPSSEGLGAGGTVIGDGSVVSAKVEEIGNGIVDGEKPLHLAGRLEALHLVLSPSSWLIRVFGPVVDALVLAVLHLRRPVLSLQKLAQQTLGRPGIALALDQHVEHETVLIDGPPQVMFAAADATDPRSRGRTSRSIAALSYGSR